MSHQTHGRKQPKGCFRVGDIVRPRFKTVFNPRGDAGSSLEVRTQDVGIVLDVFEEEVPGGVSLRAEVMCIFHGYAAWWADDELEVVTDARG